MDIRFTGPISNNKVFELYRTTPIDLFINVSKSEGIPVSIMEALSVSIPVLATNCGGIEEIVNNEVGYIISSDPSAE